MKKLASTKILSIPAFALLLFAFACNTSSETKEKELAINDEEEMENTTIELPKKPLSEEFKKYWYAGDAEITSYELEQARYGEIRTGKSVLIYVTEPFLPEKQVKADRSNPGNVPVLKLNATKKYLTGIYPYSIMSSTFYPVYDNQHAIKTSLSVQEWCGHVYSQINNRDKFEFTSHSYFESEADQNLSIDKNILENEIWSKIRINPADLPVGNLKMVPSLEYVRLRHKELKAYNANASLDSEGDNSIYTIAYPELERTLSITFSSSFPYTVEGWKEEFKSGFGPNAKILETKATRLKSLKTPYWGQNGNDDEVLRESLGL
ncbi:septum formation inhibitor Maf [Flagellimonas sp.]|uniref:septum formation inhibitor Maf n=1 Tax=Flagellimonas sp. TaxID=2058762 RepID=UPI003F49E9F3